MAYLGESIGKLGFGLMRLPMKGDAIDVEQTKEMVDLFLKAGFTYFDTAWAYAGSEDAIRQALVERYPRESFQLATKNAAWINCKTREEAVAQFDTSLKQTGAGYFDFYLLHALDKEKFAKVKKFDIYNKMLKYKAEGKIRRLGFSFHDTPDVIDEITNTYAFDFAQIQFNYLDWVQQDAERTYKILESKEIPIVVMEPVRGGFLHRLPDAMTKVFQQKDPNASNASWALRWVADHPQVKVILSGMSSMEQVDDNLQVLSNYKPLTEDELKTIETVRDMLRSQATVPCTACEYCMSECPMGIQIPAIFKIYNEYTQSLNVGKMKREYKEIPDEHKAHNCISCGACAAKCPQHIEIYTELAKIDQLIQKL